MIRIVGAACLMAGCAGFGWSLTAASRREQMLFRQLIRALQEMQWELKYRLTELPELCRLAADTAGEPLGEVFRALEGKLLRREAEDVGACFRGILSGSSLPRSILSQLKLLGDSLGRYDLEGQLQGLEEVRRSCRKQLTALEARRPEQLRCCRILALCSGAALAILLI